MTETIDLSEVDTFVVITMLNSVAGVFDSLTEKLAQLDKDCPEEAEYMHYIHDERAQLRPLMEQLSFVVNRRRLLDPDNIDF